MRAPEYLDIYKAWRFVGTETEFGADKTLRIRWSVQPGGDPETVPLIGTMEKTATLSGGEYTIDFLPEDFAQLETADRLFRPVYAHISDGASWRDARHYVPVDTDPDVLPSLSA